MRYEESSYWFSCHDHFFCIYGVSRTVLFCTRGYTTLTGVVSNCLKLAVFTVSRFMHMWKVS